MRSSQLSSEILEEQFGSTELRILYQDESVRLISTIVKESKKVLEISRVRFISVPSSLGHVHAAVLAGESMGAAFKTRGIAFRREPIGIWRAALPVQFEKLFAQTGEATIIKVAIFIAGSQEPYAEILETYSPDVVWPKVSDRALPDDVRNELEAIKLSTP